jgi:hypothetical protein
MKHNLLYQSAGPVSTLPVQTALLRGPAQLRREAPEPELSEKHILAICQNNHDFRAGFFELFPALSKGTKIANEILCVCAELKKEQDT